LGSSSRPTKTRSSIFEYLILIQVFKDKSGNYKKIHSEGHATKDRNSEYSLLCAGVSILLQTLHYNFRIMSNVSCETVEVGKLGFEIIKVTDNTNLVFKSIFIGIENLAKSSAEITILYKELGE
jgi:uncharacterized protein YsxB (DUF464 family)